MKANLALAYACDVVSYCIQKLEPKDLALLDQVVLFGSVVRGDATMDSDLDLFVETSRPVQLRKSLARTLEAFEASTKVRDYWRPLGISLPVSLKVGQAKDWAVLPAALREQGRVLYGPYRPPSPQGAPQVLLSWENIPTHASRVNLYRNLYGYMSHGKRYEGLLRSWNGERVTKGAILVPLEKMDEALRVFRRYQVTCRVRTLCSYEADGAR